MKPLDSSDEFERVSAVTQRPYAGEMIDLRTKMGRRLTVTADHPMIARHDGGEPTVVLAGDLTDSYWLPIAVGDPLHEQLAADWMGDRALDEAAWQSIGAEVSGTPSIESRIWYKLPAGTPSVWKWTST